MPVQSITLNGSRVLVTRPAERAKRFCELIESSGGVAIAFPVIDIIPATQIARAESLAGFDMAVFISVSAVEATLALLDDRLCLPACLAAIGGATARALERHGYYLDIRARAPFNSEALLATPEMNHVSGKRIVIFRGEGGREHLAETLRARGAEIEYREVYRRETANVDASVLLSYLQAHKIDMITVTSVEVLEKLFRLAGKEAAPLLEKLPFVVLSERIAEQARNLHVDSEIEIAEQADDNAMLAAIARLERKIHQGH